jgi:hypothetical protein
VHGYETSPQLYHISRFGTKAFWLSSDDEQQVNIIKSAALPSFAKQKGKDDEIPIKQVLLDPSVDTRSLRAFDIDEVSADFWVSVLANIYSYAWKTAPVMAFAEEEMLWILEAGHPDIA